MNRPAWLERLDTSGFDRPGETVRVLVVRNDGPDDFDGIARLAVDFRTRATPPIRVETRDGAPVPCGVEDEALGPLEQDGKRRWRFTLAFRARLPAGQVDGWRAVWGAAPAESLDARGLASLPAWECECRPGDCALPCGTHAVDRHEAGPGNG